MGATNHQLPEFGQRYLRHVLAEYASLPPDALKLIPKDVLAVLDRANGNPTSGPPGSPDLSTMTWGDLFLLEKAMLVLQPEATLRRRVWGIRGAFRELAGQKQYDGYLASNPPNADTADIANVRADLDRLVDNLHWNYALIPIREEMRNNLIRSIGGWLLFFAVVTLGLVWLLVWGGQTLLATLLLLLLAGAVGGFTSLLQRIQSIPSDGDPLISIFELQKGEFSIRLAPISGAIFAVVLYLIFLGGLLSGGFFPDHLKTFGLHLGPLQWTAGANYMLPLDYAKLLLWAFIAGFAERFVPDTLDRLVTRAEQAQAPAQQPVLTPQKPVPAPQQPAPASQQPAPAPTN